MHIPCSLPYKKTSILKTEPLTSLCMCGTVTVRVKRGSGQRARLGLLSCRCCAFLHGSSRALGRLRASRRKAQQPVCERPLTYTGKTNYSPLAQLDLAGLKSNFTFCGCRRKENKNNGESLFLWIQYTLWDDEIADCWMLQEALRTTSLLSEKNPIVTLSFFGAFFIMENIMNSVWRSTKDIMVFKFTFTCS